MNPDSSTLRALAALRNSRPAQFRAVAHLLKHPGSTHQAIAEALGTSRVNVTKLLRRGLKNLEALKKAAVRDSAGERNNS